MSKMLKMVFILFLVFIVFCFISTQVEAIDLNLTDNSAINSSSNTSSNTSNTTNTTNTSNNTNTSNSSNSTNIGNTSSSNTSSNSSRNNSTATDSTNSASESTTVSNYMPESELGLTNILNISYNAAYRARTNCTVNPYVLFAWQRICELRTEQIKIGQELDVGKLKNKVYEIKNIMNSANKL